MLPRRFKNGWGSRIASRHMPKFTKRFVDSLRPDGSSKDLFYWEAGT